MFDLGTILYLNNSRHSAAANPGVVASIERGGVTLRPSAQRKRALARRVALYARDAGVSLETARLIVRLRDREQSVR
jgi:hypothetical protein